MAVEKIPGKNNMTIVTFARAMLGHPYWYATYGQLATEELYKAKKKQYTNYYKASDFPTQYGKRVCDCVGLVKFAMWADTPESKPVYNASQDTNAAGMFIYASVRGDNMATMPLVPGILVFKESGGKIGHVGVYVGNDEVIEAKGHAYGVVKTKLTGGGWVKWSECPWIEYVAEPETCDVTVPVLKKGMKGVEAIKTLQRILRELGYRDGAGNLLAVDGSFGPATDYAVRAFQKGRGLSVDGSVGPATWTSLIAG